VDADTLRQAERLIESCEACNEEGAEIPFDAVLDSRDQLGAGSALGIDDLLALLD
jgi:hypothetical protein